MRKIRLIWVSEAATVDTGFGAVGAYVLPYLAKTGRYDVAQLGLAYSEDFFNPPNLGFPIIPFQGEGDNFGQKSLAGLVERINPDIVLYFGDEWWLNWIVNDVKRPNGTVVRAFPRELRNNFKFVPMVPIDGSPMPKHWIATFEKSDLTIVPSFFGKKEIERYNASLPVEVIYHGVDCGLFKPVTNDEKSKIKTDLLNVKPDTFVVGCVGRNQRRKCYPQLFLGFKEVLKKYPDTHLYVHAMYKDQGWNLPQLAEQTGINHRIIWNPLINRPDKGVSRDLLAKLYQGMDVFCLATVGEGFCIPELEALSCGIPVITSDYSAAKELAVRSNGGELIEPKYWMYFDGDNNFFRPYPDEKSIAKLITKMIEDPSHRKKLGENGREFALKYDWDIVSRQFDKVLSNLVYPEAGGRVNTMEV